MIKTTVAVGVTVIALVIGGVGGYLFRNYQIQRNRANFAGGSLNRNGNQNGGAGMGRGVLGSILSMDDKSITVKLADGSSRIVFFSDTTHYSNTTDATKGDLKVGENVAVFGTPNSDGSETAGTIQINPQFFRPSPTP